MSIKNNLKRVFTVNILTLVMGLITSFIIPSVLSIKEYSNLKTYMLYISYVGLLHFGFIDGMYVKYGGKNIDEINKSELKLEHRVFLTLQLTIMIIFALIGIFIKNLNMVLFSISILPINLFSFYKFLYQATGEFKKFSKISYIYISIEMILTVLVIFNIKDGKYIYYCIPAILANIFSVILLEIKFSKQFKKVVCKYDKKVWNNIKVGIYILLANFSVIILYGIDKWFVKIIFDDYSFAYYSFAVSLLSIITVLINSVSLVFYNYLFEKNNDESINSIKNIFFVLGAIFTSGYFVIAFVVQNILPKYMDSINVIGISFLAYPYILVINILYVNLYKYKKIEKKYLKSVLSVLIFAILCNFIFVSIFKTVTSITMATYFVYLFWMVYSAKDFEFISIKLKDICYLILIFVSFMICKKINLHIIAFSIYNVITLILSIIFYKKDLFNFIEPIKNKIIKVKQ